MSSKNQESATLTASQDRPAHEEEHHVGLEFVRFVPLERGTHATMVVSFITLAVSVAR